MKRFELLGSYFVDFKVNDSNSVVSHVSHVQRNRWGGSLETPVGFLCCHFDDIGFENVLPHWQCDLFLRTDVAYDEGSGVARALCPEERSTWDGPYYHADLPSAMADLLLKETCCTQPLLLSVHEGVNSACEERGQVHVDD